MTDTQTPLEVLNLNPELVQRAFASKGFDSVLELAESSYRMLSLFFHPDKPTGDNDEMARLSQAIADLRDPDVLQYYVEDMLEVDDETIERRQVFDRIDQRKTVQVNYLIGMLDYVDHFQLLGIDRPASLVCTDHVLDVVSPKAAHLYAWTPTKINNLDNFSGSEYLFVNRTWIERRFFKDNSFQDCPADNLTLVKRGVKIVGSYNPMRHSTMATSHPAHQALLAASSPPPVIDWQTPDNTWYLTDLSSQVKKEAMIVLYSGGQFASCGALYGMAYV